MGNQTSTRRSSNASQLPRSEHTSAKATGTHEYLAVDGGLLFPATGIYKHVKQEWDQATVHKLIQDRRLAPFYRGLQDEYQLDSPAAQATLSDAPNDLDALLDDVGVQQGQEFLGIQIKLGQRSTEPEAHKRAERQAYERGTEECPICMMNYPSNMNMSRCCDQPICTECLVQIKRADPDVNHIEPEAVACPFCVEPDFGVVYTPPALMNRRLASGAPVVAQPSPTGALPTLDFTPTELVSSPKPANEPRRKSHSATSPDVVLIDTLYPHFSDKVEAVRAAIQRRANRRIVFRHVGDRLVPVGITSSRDMAALLEGQLNQLNNGGSASAGRRSNGTGSPRRQRRRNTNATNEGHPYGHVGQDLEDLMLNEAIRLSLLEAEESARRQPEDASRTATATAAPAPAPVPLPSGPSNNGRTGSASSSPAARLELDSPTTTAFELSRAFNDSLPDLHARNASPTPASSIRSGSISSSAPTPLPKSPVLATASPNPSSFSSSPLSRSPPEFSTTPAISSPLASMTPQLADSEAEAEVDDAERLRRQSSTHSSLVPRPLDTPASEISSIFDPATAPYMQLED